MHCVWTISSSIVCPAVLQFSTISQKTARFWKKKLLNIKYVFWFSLQICLKHYQFLEEFSEICSKMYIGLHVKYRYACQVLMKLEILRHILKNIEMPNFIKILPVGSELFHDGGGSERQIDLTELIAAFPIIGTRPRINKFSVTIRTHGLLNFSLNNSSGTLSISTKCELALCVQLRPWFVWCCML
jgi:hypothetical protein